jgi:hypothetical protein
MFISHQFLTFCNHALCFLFQTIERLENMVEGGNYYEAQQMYKSTSARYLLCNFTEHGSRVVGSLP